MPKDIAGVILNALEQGAEQEGLDIVSVQVSGPGSHPTVSVRIDTLADGDITMDEVVSHTDWVSQVVEAVDPFPGSYELEVSSPGLDRPLRRLSDFDRFVGQKAEVVLTQELDGRRKGTGEIVGTEEQNVEIKLDGSSQLWSFPIDLIKNAHIKPDYAAIFANAKKSQADGDIDDDIEEDIEDSEDL